MENFRDLVLHRFSYDKDTGTFTWVNPARNHLRLIGRLVGSIDAYGYRTVKINNKVYKIHRLVWFIETGELPTKDIDHINGKCADNRFNNLREVSMRENQQNQKRHRGGRLVGAQFKAHILKRPWAACVSLGGKRKHLGYYKSEAEAHAAYNEYLLGAT